ncbi:MAG: cyclic nucleotide-binding domain-containing protein [Anaerolineae bacterium]|nr:cyclic nucleotide-binding domain-containing protein [Anaerolineae bacterium]
MSEETTIQLFKNAKDVEIAQPDQVIFFEGQPGDTMYVIQEGVVDIYLEKQQLHTVEVGGIFGEMALINNAKRNATAIARTECKLVPINKERFMFLVQQTPNFALKVMQVLSDRLLAQRDRS